MTKYGVVGVGYWGRNHLRSLIKLREEGLIDHLVACDSSEFALKQIEEYDCVERKTNWRELLKDEDLEMVSIVSPSPLHYEMTKEFMLAGKDVLVEKPLAMSSTECKQLMQIEKETGKGLMVGHIFRFHPAILELRERIKQREFGDILYITVRRTALRTPRRDMGVMLALGIHEVDLNCFLLGDKNPDSIFADVNYLFDNQEEMAFILQKFGKISAYSFESWVDPTKGKLRELSLVGSLKSAVVNFLIPDEIKIISSYIKVKENKDHKLLEAIHGGETVIRVQSKEPLLEEIRHFINKSKTDKIYDSNSFIGMRAVQMVEKALESNEKRSFVEFN